VLSLLLIYLEVFLVNYFVLFKEKIFSFLLIANYRVPNMPANGWWHEWTFNYDVKVDNNEVHLDIAEHEAKILVWLGDNWEPAPPAPAPEPTAESPPVDQSNATSQEQQQQQPDASTNQNPDPIQSATPSQ
jgi:hypothetical protein